MLSLTPAQKIALGVVVMLALTAGGLLTWARTRGAGTPADVSYQVPALPSTELRVHVVGAVNRPGLYRLAQGARVQDAVNAAGGLRSDAIPGSINLAGFVDDGEQIVVEAAEPSATDQPSSSSAAAQPAAPPQAHMVGASAAVPPPAAGAPQSRPAVDPQPSATTSDPPWEQRPELAPICINTADLEQLKSLPGIGEQLAMRILYYRHENGPFQTYEQLLEVDGVGSGRLETIRTHTTLR